MAEPPADRTDPRALRAAPLASRHLFGRLWRGYLRRHMPMMALAFGLMVVEGMTLGALSYLIQPLFDDVFAPGGQPLLVWVGLAILGLFVLRAATAIASRVILTSIAQKSSTAMQVDLLAHVLTLDAAFFQANPPGALIERVQGDTAAVQGLWTSVITGVGRDAVALVSLGAVAVAIDPAWTLAALVGTPLLVLPALAIQRYIRRKTAQMRDRAGNRATRLDEIFHGIQAVKLNGMERYQTDRFRRVVRDIRRAEVRMAASRSTIPGLIDVVTGLGFFAVLLLGGREVAEGERTVGEFMAFFTAMVLTFQPMRRLGDMAGVWQIAAASLDRIYALLDERPAVARPAGPAPALPRPPGIRFEDVRLAYDGQVVLDGLTFEAEPGRMTALVGASGAGKTTVFNLLTALADPQGGRILIGGVDAATIPLADLRALFAVVSQDAALFDESLLENVALGRDVAPEALDRALGAAHVADFLDGLPQGLETPVGPRGSALSGGQRQRVAIARAVLRDAPILLLDEATSALDAQSEAQVSAALADLGRGRTTLVIAHRLATVRAADRIVVLDRGRVAETGTHDDLLARGGLYAGLHRLQIRPGDRPPQAADPAADGTAGAGAGDGCDDG